MEKNTVIAIDLAKTKFQVAVSHEPGRVDRVRRLDRPELLAFFAQTPAATVVIEACGSAHHWAREIEQGPDVQRRTEAYELTLLRLDRRSPDTPCSGASLRIPGARFRRF